MGPRALRVAALALALASLGLALAAPLAVDPLGRMEAWTPAGLAAGGLLSDGRLLLHLEGRGATSCTDLPGGIRLPPECRGPWLRMGMLDLATQERRAFSLEGLGKLARTEGTERLDRVLLAEGALLGDHGILDLRTGTLAEGPWPGGFVPAAREGSTLYLVGHRALWRMDLAAPAEPERIPWPGGEPREAVAVWGYARGLLLMHSRLAGADGPLLELVDAATGAARALPLDPGQQAVDPFDRQTAALDATHAYVVVREGEALLVRSFALPDLAPVATMPVAPKGVPLRLTAADGRWVLTLFSGGSRVAHGTAAGPATLAPMMSVQDAVVAGDHVALQRGDRVWLAQPGGGLAPALSFLGLVAALAAAALAVLAHALGARRVLLGVPAGACPRCARRERVLQGFCTACGEVLPPAR